MYISFLVNACCCFFCHRGRARSHSQSPKTEKDRRRDRGKDREPRYHWLMTAFVKKKSTPSRRKARFFDPPPPSTWNSKTAWASSHIRISIAFNPPPPVGFSSMPSVVGMWIFSGITEWSFSYSWILTNSPSQSPGFGDQYTLLTRCILWSCLVRESWLKKACPAFHFCIHSLSVNEHC